MTTRIRGELVIHHELGVIEFYNTDTNFLTFKLQGCKLPIPSFDKPAQCYKYLAVKPLDGDVSQKKGN